MKTATQLTNNFIQSFEGFDRSWNFVKTAGKNFIALYAENPQQKTFQLQVEKEHETSWFDNAYQILPTLSAHLEKAGVTTSITLGGNNTLTFEVLEE